MTAFPMRSFSFSDARSAELAASSFLAKRAFSRFASAKSETDADWSSSRASRMARSLTSRSAFLCARASSWDLSEAICWLRCEHVKGDNQID